MKAELGKEDGWEASGGVGRGIKAVKVAPVYSVGKFYMIQYKGVNSRQQLFRMSKRGKTCSENPILKVVKAFDLFSFEKFIRFKKEDEFKTSTGGICSIILIVLFIVLFSSTALATFRKDEVNHQVLAVRMDEPLMLGAMQQEKFQFAVGIQGANLLQLPSYFEIQLLAKVSQRGKLISRKQYNLEPCKRQTFGPVSDNIDDVFQELQMNEWLCLPQDVMLELNGTNSGQKLTYAELLVVRCNKSRSACVDDSQIDRYIAQNGDFILKVYFTNPSINPGEKQYLSYYLDDTNEYPFSNKIGVNANLFFSQYTINTDDSILPQPFSSRKVEKGSFVDGNLDAVKNYMVDSNVYARVSLRKSMNSFIYERSFRRVDDTLSYIGGLFGGLIMLMIFIKKYNEYSFNLQLAEEMVHQKGESIQEQRFNIFTYPAFLFYKLVTSFKQQWAKKWPLFKKYDECCEEMEHQLSIDYLLKRIMFLEKVMELNFSKEYFEGINLHQKVELDMVRQKREKYDDHELIKTELEKTINRSIRQQNSGSPLAAELRGRPSPTSIRSFGSANLNSITSKARKRTGSNHRVVTAQKENIAPSIIDETQINLNLQNVAYQESFEFNNQIIEQEEEEESYCSSPKVGNFMINPSPLEKNSSENSQKDKSNSGGKRGSAKKQNFIHPFN